MSFFRKTLHTLALSVTFLLLSQTGRGADSPWREQFDRGLLQEELHQDLDKAIEHYRANVDAFDAQRDVIAMSLFRLAECYRKQGQMDKAAPLYARITKEFTDQQSLVLLSQRFVPATGQSTRSEESVNAVDIESLVARLDDASAEEVMHTLSLFTDDEIAAELLTRYHGTETTLASLEPQYGGNHPAVLSERSKLKSIRTQMERHAEHAVKYFSSRLARINPKSVSELTREPKDLTRLDDNPESLKALIDELEKLPPAAALDLLMTETDVRVPYKLVGEVDMHRLALAEYKNRYRPNHPTYIQAKQTLSDKEAALNQEIKQAIEQLRIKLRILEKSPSLSNSPIEQGASPADNPSVVNDREQQELERYRRMAQEQPDLLARGPIEARPHLHYAVESGFVELARFILDHGADVNRVDKQGMTPLHRAADSGNLDTVRLLLQQTDIQADPQDYWHQTPLHLAVDDGSLAMAQLLVDAGANVNAQVLSQFALKSTLDPLTFDVIRGQHRKAYESLTLPGQSIPTDLLLSYPDLLFEANTPLHISSYRGYNKLTRWLILECDVDVDATNRWGLTPLLFHLTRSIAPADQQLSITRLLLENGANPSQMGFLHNTTWADPENTLASAHLVRRFQNTQNTRMPNRALTPKPKQSQSSSTGYSSAPVDSFQTSPLHVSVFLENDISRLLLQHGADINQRDSNGSTPLHELFIQTDEDRTKEFIQTCAQLDTLPPLEPMVKNEQGFIALDYAVLENRHLEAAIDYLKLVPKETLTDVVEQTFWTGLKSKPQLPSIRSFLAELIHLHPSVVNKAGRSGHTPIEHAIVRHASEELVQWLQDHGATPPPAERIRLVKQLLRRGFSYEDDAVDKRIKMLDSLEETSTPIE